jgi:hypothetical protein
MLAATTGLGARPTSSRLPQLVQQYNELVALADTTRGHPGPGRDDLYPSGPLLGGSQEVPAAQVSCQVPARLLYAAWLCSGSAATHRHHLNGLCSSQGQSCHCHFGRPVPLPRAHIALHGSPAGPAAPPQVVLPSSGPLQGPDMEALEGAAVLQLPGSCVAAEPEVLRQAGGSEASALPPTLPTPPGAPHLVIQPLQQADTAQVVGQGPTLPGQPHAAAAAAAVRPLEAAALRPPPPATATRDSGPTRTEATLSHILPAAPSLPHMRHMRHMPAMPHLPDTSAGASHAASGPGNLEAAALQLLQASSLPRGVDTSATSITAPAGHTLSPQAIAGLTGAGLTGAGLTGAGPLLHEQLAVTSATTEQVASDTTGTTAAPAASSAPPGASPACPLPPAPTCPGLPSLMADKLVGLLGEARVGRLTGTMGPGLTGTIVKALGSRRAAETVSPPLPTLVCCDASILIACGAVCCQGLQLQRNTYRAAGPCLPTPAWPWS